jgi:hypothetical protein
MGIFPAWTSDSAVLFLPCLPDAISVTCLPLDRTNPRRVARGQIPRERTGNTVAATVGVDALPVDGLPSVSWDPRSLTTAANPEPAPLGVLRSRPTGFANAAPRARPFSISPEPRLEPTLRPDGTAGRNRKTYRGARLLPPRTTRKKTRTLFTRCGHKLEDSQGCFPAHSSPRKRSFRVSI